MGRIKIRIHPSVEGRNSILDDPGPYTEEQKAANAVYIGRIFKSAYGLHMFDWIDTQGVGSIGHLYVKVNGKEEVILAMEEAIQKAARSKYGLERDIRANIDRKNGAINIAQFTEVVENIENESTQMTFDESQRRKLTLQIGDFYKEALPPIDFGRIAAQTAKQVISQKVREAERERQFHEYKDRVGEIVVGTIKRVENHSVTIDLGRGEAIIKRDQMIPREQLRPGDTLRCFIVDVIQDTRGPQIFLSRSSNDFLAALFTQEVPEIYDGIIVVKGVAREPGSRAKISAFSNDPSIDPVGACVGMRGSRVQAVVGELQGEKIEIIPWSEDPVTFVINALAPAVPSKVVMDEDAGRMEVVVPDDQLSLAIGRRGQNVRLASQLTGWYVDILTEALDLTTGDRHDEYGDCNVELDRVATMWSVIFESNVTPNQVALAMIALKLTRQMHTNKRDNWVDIAGYARVGNLVNNQK